MLISRLIDDAAGKNMTLTLKSHRQNEPAARFYRKLGFVTVAGDDLHILFAREPQR